MFEVRVTVEAPDVCAAVRELAAAMVATVGAPRAVNTAEKQTPVQQVPTQPAQQFTQPTTQQAPVQATQPPQQAPAQLPQQFTQPAPNTVAQAFQQPVQQAPAARQYTADEIAALHPFVQFYRDHGALLRSGSYYRLAAPDGRGAVWAIAAADGSEAVVFAAGATLDGRRQPLPFARPGARYAVQARYTGGTDETAYAAEALAAPGLPLPVLRGEVPGYIAWLHAQA